jgi:hypothetical protein
MLKKNTIIITIICIISIFLISSNCFAPDNCVSDGCYTSKGALIQCGGSWDDVYGGVAYHCNCVCGPCDQDPSQCVSATGGISGGSGSAIRANMQSDVQGTAFFSRNPVFETGDWADDNGLKWEAFEARVLQAGYADMSSFINSGTSGMPFNDFVYQATMKYLNNNYFNNNSGDSKLIRDDSSVPDASFYTGNGKNNNPPPADTPTPTDGGPNLPPGFDTNDLDGVYIQGSVPQILGGGNITFEEMERLRLNSVINRNGSTSADAAQLDGMQDEVSARQGKPDEIISSLSEGIGTAIDPGSDYLAEETGKKIAGVIGGGEEVADTGATTAGILTSVYNIGKDLSKGDATGALSELPGGVVALLPESLSGAGGVAVTGGAVYTYFAGKVGDRDVESVNGAVSGLTGVNTDVTGGRSFSETADEVINNSFKGLKGMIFEKKNLDGSY